MSASNAGVDVGPAVESRLIKLASWILEKLWTVNGSVILRWWRGELWVWDGRCYKVIPDDEVQAHILLHLGNKVDKMSPQLAAGILACVKALVLIPNHCNQPLWLDDSGKFVAGRHLISMSNGLLDVDALLRGESDVLGPASSRWFSPVAVDYGFERDASCPQWNMLLATWLESDEPCINLLQEWFGYCLTSDTSQQKALFLEGEGANGKSVAILTLKKVLGPENCSEVPLELFGDRFSLASTLGKLVNVCGDTAEMDKTAEGFIKQFTGGDEMQFDRKYKPPVSARPTAKLVVAMNNRPRFSDRSDGIWRRILLMPWRVRIDEARQDRRLVRSDQPDWPLLPELPGIFNWAIEGLKRLKSQTEFTIPQRCRDALAEYRQESNPASMFLADRCEKKPEASVSSQNLYIAYRTWCYARGYRPLAVSAFGKEVLKDGSVIKSRGGGSTRRMEYKGINLFEET